jgi:hypothetical protein
MAKGPKIKTSVFKHLFTLQMMASSKPQVYEMCLASTTHSNISLNLYILEVVFITVPTVMWLLEYTQEDSVVQGNTIHQCPLTYTRSVVSNLDIC